MNRIKLLRYEYGDKQLDLAAYLDISQARLSNWERGKYQPPKKMIFKIADRYGVSTDYLMGYSDSREFAMPDPIRLLQEYLQESTGRDFEVEQLVALDDIVVKIAKLL